MKVKSLKKDWTTTWVTTLTSIIALVFTVLVGFGVITPEQSANAQPLIGTLLGAVSTGIAAVMALIGIFVKQE